MARNIFVLGAGASRECGGPLMLDFLDVAQDLVREGPDADLVFRAEMALRAVYVNANLDLRNIESLWSAFEMAQLLGRVPGLDRDEIERLDSSLRTVIVRTLSQALRPRYTNSDDPGMPPPYDEFWKLLERVMSYCVITFNYDLAVDVSLNAERGDYYVQGKAPMDRLLSADEGQILKLHGSLHWARCANSECGSITACGWQTPLAGLRVGLTLDRHRCAKCGSSCLPEPVIVPPTWYKTQAHRALQAVWRRAAQELGDARNVFVIGYSLPESDRFFRDLFGLATIGAPLRRLRIYDPEPDRVEQRWRAFLGPGALPYLKGIRATFSDAIREMWDLLRKDDQFD